MTLLEWQGWLMICLEAGVLWILIKEFNYDKEKYERQAQRKKSKEAKAPKAIRDAEVLAPSDSGRSPETAGRFGDAPKP
jgi:hypothetical protein